VSTKPGQLQQFAKDYTFRHNEPSRNITFNKRIINARRADARERQDIAGKTKQHDEMRSHYDFSGGVRGKYAARYAEGTNVVVLAPDVAEVFPDSIAVNEALRTLVRMSAKTVRVKPASKRRAA
jgi:hypothetical protein